MKCTVTFSIPGVEPMTFDLETDQESALTDQDILKVLQEDEEKRNALCDMLHTRLYRLSSISEVTVSTLTKAEGLIGNCGVDYLREQFPEIDFPEGVDANVLLVNNLRIGKAENIYGRIINSNGQELFIVKGNSDDVARLAGFLRNRQLLEELAFQFSEESANYKNLEKILKVRQKEADTLDNVFDLMIDFLYTKKDYKNIYITNEKGEKENAFNILLKLHNIISQYGGRIEYDDPFVNTINLHVWHKDNNTKLITLDSVYGAVEAYYPEILKELELNNKTKFHNFFSLSSSLTSELLKKVFNEIADGPGYATLFATLFSEEPEFLLIFNSVDNKSIIFKSIPKTLQAKYGIEYDTIHSYDIITGEGDYKGYKIYAFWDGEARKFIPSRGYLTEATVAKIYDTKEDVMKYIDESIQKQDIKKNSFIDFKYRKRVKSGDDYVWEDELPSFTLYSRQTIEPGTIIESIDIPVDRDIRLHNGEGDMFIDDRQNYSTFKKRVEGWDIDEGTKNIILSNIDNAEKIAVFIYKVNEYLEEDRSNSKVMQEIVEEINSAGKRAYYIDSRVWMKGKNKNKYRVIPTNGIEIEQYRKPNGKRTPIISLMTKIGEVLSNKFNVPVNMRTADEISREFKDVDVNTARAFIRDGQIYINTTIAKSSDLLHEYTHLILGVLKTDPKLRSNYEQLLGIVAATDLGKDLMRKLGERYMGLSKMDLMEEVFAKLFSGHIMDNLNKELTEIFEGQERFLKDATKIIFNNGIDDLKSFYGKTLETAFTRFSSDVSALLSRKDLDFSSTKTSRLYSTWISELILKYKDTEGKEGIKELCYG